MKKSFFIVALLAVGWFVVESWQRTAPPDADSVAFPETLFEEAEQSLSEFDRSEYDEDRRLLRRLRGRHASVEDGQVRIERALVDEYKEDGQRWRLEADEGWLSREDRSVRLRGNVRMFRTDDRSDDSAVLRISGDELEWPQQGEEVIWKGEVTVQEGGIELRTVWLRVWDRDESHGFEARGEGSSFTDRRAANQIIGRARRLVYDGKRQHLRLLDGAELIRGDETFRGEELNYYPQMQR